MKILFHHRVIFIFTGIFQEHIKYLLVLTTALDVVILGVSFVDNGSYLIYCIFAWIWLRCCITYLFLFPLHSPYTDYSILIIYLYTMCYSAIVLPSSCSNFRCNRKLYSSQLKNRSGWHDLSWRCSCVINRFIWHTILLATEAPYLQSC